MKTFLIIWLAFDVLVYLLMWYDRKEHHYNFKEKMRNIKESFAQDE